MNRVHDFNMAEFQADIRQRFAATLDAAAGRSDETVLAAAMRRVQQAAETTLQAHQQTGAHIACGPGCGSCCVINVAVLYPEALAIVAYLEEGQGRAQLEQQRRALDAMAPSIRWLDDEERLFTGRACAFLDADSRCTIHPVRPLLCRGMTSTDPAACRRALTGQGLGETPTILINLFQKELFDAGFVAVAEELATRGLPAQSRKLTLAGRALLSAPAGERSVQVFLEQAEG